MNQRVAAQDLFGLRRSILAAAKDIRTIEPGSGKLALPDISAFDWATKPVSAASDPGSTKLY